MSRFFRGGIPHVLIAVGASLLLASQVSAETLTGKVVGVSDGDTITVLNADHEQFKVRLSGIDAPEKAQSFGNRSKENLSRLVFGRQVDVIWNKHDRYNRIVGKVLVADTTCRSADCPREVDACLSQITAGLAWWYEKYSKEQASEDATRYHHAETEARSQQLGLWRDPNPLPPWEWRKKSRPH
jgi:endonuclease YncB( thermonuclease family)